MMDVQHLTLEITLRSDTTFARGDGVAGVVDQDVEQDLLTGLPIIKGRTLKGLLVEECGNILYALQPKNGEPSTAAYEAMLEAAYRLFGVPGSGLEGQSILHIGTATLPPQLIRMMEAEQYKPHDLLEALTGIRHQTAVDAERDTPKDNTLRAMRVVLRDTVFVAPVDVYGSLSQAETGLLYACAATVRRVGHSRNRGRGRVQCQMLGLPDEAAHWFGTIITGGVQ